ADTDNDMLSDGFEHNQFSENGWYVAGAVNKFVTSDPLDPDDDGDGLLDGQEWRGADGIGYGEPGDAGDATDPNNRDSDGDCNDQPVATNCWDGQERGVGRDPLVGDVNVIVSLDFISFGYPGCEEGPVTFRYFELQNGNFFTQRTGVDGGPVSLYQHCCAPDFRDSDIDASCTSSNPHWGCPWWIERGTSAKPSDIWGSVCGNSTINNDPPVRRFTSFRPSEQITITSDVLLENDDSGGCNFAPESYGRMTEINLTYPFSIDDLIIVETLGSVGCGLTLEFSVTLE
ncbi:MAG: hypothetical protein ACPGXK_15205, partial [Phycisphaerae bacterium]